MSTNDLTVREVDSIINACRERAAMWRLDGNEELGDHYAGIANKFYFMLSEAQRSVTFSCPVAARLADSGDQ